MEQKRLYKKGDWIQATGKGLAGRWKGKFYLVAQDCSALNWCVITTTEGGFDIRDVTLVRAADAPFKKGDKVRLVTRTGSNYCSTPEGKGAFEFLRLNEVYTVKRDADDCMDYLSFEEGPSYGEWHCCFALETPVEALPQGALEQDPYPMAPKENKEMSELEVLVAKAQDALSALERAEGVQVLLTNATHFESPIRPRDIRIVLKPTLPAPFKLPDSGYKVQIEKDSVHVGCQKFDLYYLRENLKAALADKTTHEDFEARKSSLLYKRNNGIRWADAEELLRVLETVKQ